MGYLQTTYCNALQRFSESPFVACYDDNICSFLCQQFSETAAHSL